MVQGRQAFCDAYNAVRVALLSVEDDRQLKALKSAAAAMVVTADELQAQARQADRGAQLPGSSPGRLCPGLAR